MPLHSADSTIANIGHTAAWGGGGIAVFGGLTANELAALSGIVIGLAGLCVQVAFSLLAWRYKRRNSVIERRLHEDENQRRKERHELEVTRLKQDLVHRTDGTDPCGPRLP